MGQHCSTITLHRCMHHPACRPFKQLKKKPTFRRSEALCPSCNVEPKGNRIGLSDFRIDHMQINA
eukprot:315100-Chlamydomonas_euryale.AAC.5